MRYFIYLAYDGTRYHGWQIQPNGISVQETLMQALATFLRREVEVTGAGRTDAGVHARLMVAHFDYDSPLDGAAVTDKLNRLLPPDISVYRVVPVRPEAHARFDATSRTYHYFVSTRKDPFNRHYAWRLFQTPDFERMNEAARTLMDYTDFTSFSKLHTDVKTNNCRVMQAEWTQVGPHRMALHHPGRPLPAQHGARRSGHADGGGPRQTHGGGIPPRHRGEESLQRRHQCARQRPLPGGYRVSRRTVFVMHIYNKVKRENAYVVIIGFPFSGAVRIL